MQLNCHVGHLLGAISVSLFLSSFCKNEIFFPVNIIMTLVKMLLEIPLIIKIAIIVFIYFKFFKRKFFQELMLIE